MISNLKNRIMKKTSLIIFVSTIVAFILSSGNCLKAQEISKSEITFEKTEHDFGTMDQGGNGEIEFKFSNSGTEPLVLSKVNGCCGVTVVDWTKSPVNPGESGNVKLKYNTSRVGVINKTVTVSSNAANNPTVALRLKGNINFKEPDGDK